ncbi:hypothetical protein GUITHDRAFT_116768 [Guillardia theta CCMP2712]|uniref:Uncharacterized protein n=1 Tax=Guillardia theta (strain CCMP2712) TaxID=905079 RepID=L1ILB9_GUITC|nr:hypothetical protein GUITHDRAFT_116768 [Guillardia theta CCMP2712]EKX37041.1 hypothetical protein GUITHDRAFT_116768 [Guillardia theta CCMP2712]|eukprot:XP_005824021.1 hypothetical protein GUITHDRAFT_116768 [Guillardia theta CCMP2712]
MGISNDVLSSIKIPSGLQVELFEHEYKGRTLTLTSDVLCLVDYNFNDITTSFIITALSPPTTQPQTTTALRTTTTPAPTTTAGLISTPPPLSFNWSAHHREIFQPLVWYTFDDPNDLGKDSSGNGYNATNHGATHDSAANCKRGQGCVHFSASGAQQYMTMDSRLDLGSIQQTSGITVSFWGYMSAGSGSYARFFDFGGGQSNNNWLVAVPEPATDQRLFQVHSYHGASNVIVDSYYNYMISIWHQFVISIYPDDGSALANKWFIWVDNVLVCDACETDRLYSVSNVAQRGWYLARSHWSGDGKTDGGLDDFRVYDGVLTPSQVAQLYTDSVTVACSPPATTSIPTTTTPFPTTTTPFPTTTTSFPTTTSMPTTTPAGASPLESGPEEPMQVWAVYPAYITCRMLYTWDQVNQGQRARVKSFRSGGLGNLMIARKYEVWVCSYQDECAKPGNAFCYVYDEQRKLFLPWGLQEDLMLS